MDPVQPVRYKTHAAVAVYDPNPPAPFDDRPYREAIATLTRALALKASHVDVLRDELAKTRDTAVSVAADLRDSKMKGASAERDVRELEAKNADLAEANRVLTARAEAAEEALVHAQNAAIANEKRLAEYDRASYWDEQRRARG